MKNLSRRAFLKLSGAALLAAGLTGTLTACGGGKDVEIPGTVNGIGYVSGKAGRTILGTNEYGIIHVVEVVVTLKNVSSRPVTLTADNFPAEIDNSASAPPYFGFASDASGESWWTQSNYELQPNEETTFVLIYRISESAYNSWFKQVHTVSLTFTSGSQKMTGSYTSATGEFVVGEVEKA